MKNKKIILMGVVLVFVLVIGVSFAIWQITLQQESTNVITTGCFDIRLVEDANYNGITISNAYPISDEEGLTKDPYTFTLKNNCSAKAQYYVNLETLTGGDKRLLEKYLKASLEKGEENIFRDNLKDNYQNMEQVIPDATKAFKLYQGFLNPNEEITFHLRLWMDEETPAIDEVMDATYTGKITISSTYVPVVKNKMVKMDYSIGDGSATFDINNTYTQNGKYEYNISLISFENVLNPYESAEEVVDFSEAQDGSVMGYYVKNTEDNNYTLHIQANGKIVANEDMSYYFSSGGDSAYYTIQGLENIDTSYATTMHRTFYRSKISNFDLSHFDTSKVTDMSYMFSLSSLTDLDLSGFDTSKVTSMEGMFSDMTNLTNLDVSHFDTSNVTSMGSMFAYMYNLTSLNISGFDTSNVANMNWMFYDNYDLTNITYGDKFIRKSGAFINNMFFSCPANKPTHSSWDGAF